MKKLSGKSASQVTHTAISNLCLNDPLNCVNSTGICCSHGVGNYTVSVNGEVKGVGGDFDSIDTVDLCPS
eukprot:15362816-Ditylum_brightwellii.AAC.1